MVTLAIRHLDDYWAGSRSPGRAANRGGGRPEAGRSRGVLAPAPSGRATAPEPLPERRRAMRGSASLPTVASRAAGGLVALVLLLVVPVAAAGDAPRPDEIGPDLPALVRLGMARSPKVQAARANWQAAVERLPQAGALPDPMLKFEFMSPQFADSLGRTPRSYGVEQSFPLPGTLRQQRLLAAAEVRENRAMYEQTVRDLIVDLKLSYFELLYLRGARDLSRQNVELLAHVEKLAQTRYAQGQAKLADLLKTQAQLAQLGYDQVLLGELEEVEAAKLKALLDLPSATPVGSLAPAPQAPLRATLPQLETTALAGRQELAAARARAEKTRTAVGAAKRANLPMFSAEAMFADPNRDPAMAAGDSRGTPWTLTLGITIPLWFDKDLAAVRGAEYQREAAAGDLRALENQTRADLRAVYFRLENARRLVALYEQSLIPQAAQAMSLAEPLQKQQVQDFSAFLDTQGVWLNFNLARLRAATDYQQYLARLEQVVGGSLDGLGTAPTPAVPEAPR